MITSEETGFSLDRYLEPRRALIESRLDGWLPPAHHPPSIIHEAMRYSVFAGGKRIRPLLAIAAAEAVTGTSILETPVVAGGKATLQFACALEMIHTYSLIHDDLPAMDNDDYRRGRLTCHKVYGEGIAILAGNALMTHAFELLASGRDEVPPSARLEVIERLCRAIGTEGGVIAGQVADLCTQGKPFTAADLNYIHASKTGALIEASVTCAGMLAGASPDQLADLSLFGRKTGLAFQIVDDVLDVVATSAELGKTSGKDSAGGKATYPALYGVERSREAAAKLVAEAVERLQPWGESARPLTELARFISVRRF